MAPKRALYYTYGNDHLCEETRKFIEEAGVMLQVRDIEKEPLSEEELANLIGNLQITHFLNPLSDSYKKYRLEKQLPNREELIKLIAKDYTLLRRPIVKSSRLITIGCDKRKIAEMLQLTMEEEPVPEEANQNAKANNNNNNSSSAKNNKTSQRRQSTAASK